MFKKEYKLEAMPTLYGSWWQKGFWYMLSNENVKSKFHYSILAGEDDEVDAEIIKEGFKEIVKVNGRKRNV